MYAEALIENGQTAEGIAQINRVRARPSVNMPPVSTALSQNEARKALRHERRVELNMEGLRLADMMRWTRDDGQSGTIPELLLDLTWKRNLVQVRTGKSVLMRYGDNTTTKNQNLTFPRNLLFAIPQDAMDRNKKESQNPGW